MISALQGSALFLAAVMAYHGVILGVEYRRGVVLDVIQVAGRADTERLVVVDMGDYSRALRTSDWMIRTEVGGAVCVARRSVLGRRWIIHALALPGYCPRMPGAIGLEMPHGSASRVPEKALDIGSDRAEGDHRGRAFVEPESSGNLGQSGASDLALR